MGNTCFKWLPFVPPVLCQPKEDGNHDCLFMSLLSNLSVRVFGSIEPDDWGMKRMRRGYIMCTPIRRYYLLPLVPHEVLFYNKTLPTSPYWAIFGNLIARKYYFFRCGWYVSSKQETRESLNVCPHICSCGWRLNVDFTAFFPRHRQPTDALGIDDNIRWYRPRVKVTWFARTLALSLKGGIAGRDSFPFPSSTT